MRKGTAILDAETTKPTNEGDRRTAAKAAKPMWPFAVLGVSVATWTALFFRMFRYQWADEEVHAYVATQLAHGVRLYRDIHSARPPLGLYAIAGLEKLGLSPLEACRTAVAIAIFGIVAILFWAMRKRFGVEAACLAASVFLLSVQGGGHITYTVMQFVGLGALATTVLMLEDMPLAAGLVGGIALGFGQHAIVFVGMSFVWSYLRLGLRGALKFAAGGLLAGSSVFLLGYGVGGKDFLNDVLFKHLYHFKSNAATDVHADNSELYWNVGASILDHLGIFAACILPLVLGVKTAVVAPTTTSKVTLPWYRRDTLTLAIFVLAHTAVVFGMEGGLPLYMFSVYPVLAWFAGIGLANGIAGLREARSAGFPLAILVPIALVPVIVGAVGWYGSHAMFVKRDMNEPYSYIPQIRGVEMADVQDMALIRAAAKEVAAHTTAQDTVFGEPQAGAVVALEANRKVAGQLADLATRWFKLGILDREEIARTLEADHIRYFVTPRWFYMKDPFFAAYLRKCYETPKEFRRIAHGPGHGIPSIWLYRHNDGACVIPRIVHRDQNNATTPASAPVSAPSEPAEN